MASEIELDDLSNSKKKREESTIEPRNRVQPDSDIKDSYWTWMTAAA
jgi:hypothetical protein